MLRGEGLGDRNGTNPARHAALPLRHVRLARRAKGHVGIFDRDAAVRVVDHDLPFDRVVRRVDAAGQRHGEVAGTLVHEELGELDGRGGIDGRRGDDVALVDRDDDLEVVVAFIDKVLVQLGVGNHLVLDLRTAGRPVRCVQGLREVHRQLERERVRVDARRDLDRGSVRVLRRVPEERERLLVEDCVFEHVVDHLVRVVHHDGTFKPAAHDARRDALERFVDANRRLTADDVPGVVHLVVKVDFSGEVVSHRENCRRGAAQ
mmetsp:Transcript_22915/g.71060  ORF Transcript_22915/g.71060 Transcript_22915/m.71060 type:complete len:262 (-) Transcript_22915:16-801(-)